MRQPFFRIPYNLSAIPDDLAGPPSFLTMVMLGKTAFPGFPVFTEQIAACLVHCPDNKIKGNLAGMGKKICQAQSIDCTHGSHGIPFYAGDLDKTVYGVAGQP